MSKTAYPRAAKRRTISKAGFQMDRTEFITLREECAETTEIYLREVEKTSKMLGRCTEHPLTFDERFVLLCQEIKERNAFLLHLHAKRLLHNAALCGYGALAAT
jgi:hypothetical protein